MLMGVLGASLLLSGCKVELYTGVTQKEGNEMLALLQTEGIASDKQPDKDGHIKLLVEESDVAQAIETLKRRGVRGEQIHFMAPVATPEGIKVLSEAHPDIDIFVAALDEKLNDRAYIVPGLGDAGDRIFGTL